MDTEITNNNIILANCPPPTPLGPTEFVFAGPLGNGPDNLIGVEVPMGFSLPLFAATGSASPNGFVDVPEPSSEALLGAALGLLLVRRSFNGKRLSGQSVWTPSGST
jgi:hypothetical protein